MYTRGLCTETKVHSKMMIYLFHPAREGALPGVPFLQMQVCIEEDEVNVALQVLQAPEQ